MGFFLLSQNIYNNDFNLSISLVFVHCILQYYKIFNIIAKG